jgi:hypothetical protein
METYAMNRALTVAALLAVAVTQCLADDAPTEFTAGAFNAVCLTRELERQPLDAAMKECQDFLKAIQDEEMFWRRNHRY